MPRPANPLLEILWQRRLRQQPDSGLSIHQFCLREGISTTSFYAWKRRLAARTNLPCASSPVEATFLPVVLSPPSPSQPHDFTDLITIQFTNGCRILLPIAAGVDLVCQVVETVARSTMTGEPSSC